MCCKSSEPWLNPSKMSRCDLFPWFFLAFFFSGAFWIAVNALPTCTYTYRPDISPQFPNGTQMCCGECRFISVSENCVRAEVMIVLVLCSVWIGAMIAFFFDRVFGSPLPGSLGVNCRRRLYACAPCLLDLCVSGPSLLEVSTPASRLRRTGIAVVEDEFAEYVGEEDETGYFIEEDDDGYDHDRGRRWRERALTDGPHDGLDEICHANVTVHSF